MRQPARHLQRDVVGGAVEFDRLNGWNWLGHGAAPLILVDYIASLSFTVR
jgi:hypothetical protein